MTFNIDKCRVMHLGKKKSGYKKYYLNGQELGSINEEIDLCMITTADLKPSVVFGSSSSVSDAVN